MEKEILELIQQLNREQKIILVTQLEVKQDVEYQGIILVLKSFIE